MSFSIGLIDWYAPGPETTACMSVVGARVRAVLPPAVPVGIQVLAAANSSALAVALAAGLQFIRYDQIMYIV